MTLITQTIHLKGRILQRYADISSHTPTLGFTTHTHILCVVLLKNKARPRNLESPPQSPHQRFHKRPKLEAKQAYKALEKQRCIKRR